MPTCNTVRNFNNLHSRTGPKLERSLDNTKQVDMLQSMVNQAERTNRETNQLLAKFLDLHSSPPPQQRNQRNDRNPNRRPRGGADDIGMAAAYNQQSRRQPRSNQDLGICDRCGKGPHPKSQCEAS